ncbi:MAG: outer membrane protein assembly factor BamE [Gammaproteobacteria bacterium]|nr:outer membrane protein assembly factor BamE [Gammaproteobacteria bacterium]
MTIFPNGTYVVRGTLTIALVMLITSACIKPYRVEVQQGNVVTQEMLNELKVGMSPGEVRFVLGTPMLIDAFHPDRWDYYYGYHSGRLSKKKQHRITVVFENDKFIRLEGHLGEQASAP